ncbi:hypothetical protein VNI00_017159 [Paramarasmius palmivorus]|uniref:Uncharacterized protein n=1 Tax=Paramarasmius palmivorus TaxID=297713 RepID=A0AAW0B7M0_9AGAR
MAPSLLTIPPEIRSIILEQVILAKRDAPNDLQSAETTHHLHRDNTYYNQLTMHFEAWSPGLRNVHFERQSTGYSSNSLPLLLTNHQINAETHSAMSRLVNEVRRYDLDILVSQGFWSTWTCVPILSDQVDLVTATFRVDFIPTSGFIPGDGSPPTIYWWFYFLLEYFLKRGPVVPTTSNLSRPVDREVCIRELVLNFVSTTGSNLAAKLAQEAERALSYVIGMSYHTSPYGAIIHERVGAVRLCVNGALISEVNPGEVLSKMVYVDPVQTIGYLVIREARLVAFWEWKEKAAKLRRRRGF